MDEQRNDFHNEGGVELEDVHNEARYKAKASGATVGAGGQLGSSGAGIGSDDGQASSTTKASISGIAGDKEARTGDAETGLAPIFDKDKDKVKDEVNAQVVITTGFGQQAVPMAASYADQQAVALRREGKEEEARKWDEGGEYRVGLHAAIGLLTGGVQGAVGAGAGAAIVPVVGEVIADLNLPEPVRQAVTQVAGAALGSVGGGAGAAASLNQAAHNYVTHSPYKEVNRRVSRENARLTNECGANCTAEDFRRIDQQMAALERAGTLAEIGKRNTLTPEQANDLAQAAIEMAPGYGTGESLVQVMTG
ncbi:MAG: hypothetical protein GWN66_02800, partial [Pseudomonas stutzeri]|nr:hypothetical protein [Stutzerimonas stutzeri]